MVLKSLSLSLFWIFLKFTCYDHLKVQTGILAYLQLLRRDSDIAQGAFFNLAKKYIFMLVLIFLCKFSFRFSIVILARFRKRTGQLYKNHL